MILADLLKAAVPDPVTCLGVRLRPLSLGSLLLLLRFDNAFLKSAECGIRSAESPNGIPLGDLLQAVIVCSLPFAEAQAALADPDLESELLLWADKVGSAVLVKRKSRWLLRVRNLLSGREKEAWEFPKERFVERIAKANVIFAKYFADGTKFPCTKAECGPERPIGSPWIMLTLTALMEDLHQDFNAAIDQPLTLSRWLVASNGERKGLLEVVERSEVNNLQAEADAIAKEVFGECGPKQPDADREGAGQLHAGARVLPMEGKA